MNIRDIMTAAPVIPVLVIDNIDHAIPLAEALVAGGLPVLEITMRTPQALDAVKQMSNVKGAIVGVGTANSPDHLQQAKDVGAQFAVSPGLTQGLASAAKKMDMPLLPGVATASEIIAASEYGLTALKFFPAQMAGGVPMLKAFGGPFQDVVFCPTGGISLSSAPDFLALNNVLCVGGSWVAPKSALEAADWSAIETLARDASKL